MFALDCASSEFYKDGHYVLEGEGGLKLTSAQFADYRKPWSTNIRSSPSKTVCPNTTGMAGNC